jgi:hypothetical protein
VEDFAPAIRLRNPTVAKEILSIYGDRVYGCVVLFPKSCQLPESLLLPEELTPLGVRFAHPPNVKRKAEMTKLVPL